MKQQRLLVTGLLALLLTVLSTGGQTPAVTPEPVSLDAIAKIRDEGLNRSQVMQTAGHLTDGFGPRLTGSPHIKAAADWTMSKMKEWSLSNVRLEAWGPFGRGWTNDYLHVGMVAPYRMTLIASTKAWTPGTEGTIRGEVVKGVVTTRAEADRLRGTLRGKFVLAIAPRDVTPQFQPNATRFSDEQLTTMANPPQRGARGGERGNQGDGQAGRGRGQGADGPPAPPLTVQQRNDFYREEGVLAVIEHGSGTGGNIAIQGGGDWRPNAPPVPVQIVLAVEHYGLIFRNVDRGIPVTIEANIQNTFLDKELNAFNIIGEITGTDKAREVVMVGAHFDSWHAGTGATDNAAGSAVMLEAMRILKATGLPLRRTVRIALWTGEEQGLFGSAAYVAEHFAVRQTMQLKPEHETFSVYFNVDNGTGQIRGVYTQGNDAAQPVFNAWMQPFRDFGMTTLTARGTGGTDHTSFDAVGLPGFQFIQDPIEYDTRTHHTSMDTFERLVAKDMMQNAVIVASFVYHAANREELFPRKPLPAPSAQRGGGRGGRGQ
jgi:hypothetical protein